MKLNPTAVVFWAFGGLLGFWIGGADGAVLGLLVTLGLSLMANALP